MPGGFATSPQLYALPPNSYPVTTATTCPTPAPCPVTTLTTPPCGPGYPQPGTGSFTNQVGNSDPVHVITCCGGDGGPGILQLHAPPRSDATGLSVLPPVSANQSIYTILKPAPIGSFPATGVPTFLTINNPAQWNRLLPIFGPRSQALSKWIPFGAASVNSDPSITAVTT